MSATKDTNSTSIDDEVLEPVLKKAVEVAITDHGDNFAGRKAELNIQSGHDEIGRQAVFLSINGVGFHIPRDTTVVVPAEVIEVLDNAVQKIYEKVGNNLVERSVKRYAYNVTWLAAAKIAKGAKG